MALSETAKILRDIMSGPGFHWLNKDRARRAAMLDAIAAALEARNADVLNVASNETALSIEELLPEFSRTVRTLRMFAEVVREGSWVRAAIDTKASDPQEAIGPNYD